VTIEAGGGVIFNVPFSIFVSSKGVGITPPVSREAVALTNGIRRLFPPSCQWQSTSCGSPCRCAVRSSHCFVPEGSPWITTEQRKGTDSFSWLIADNGYYHAKIRMKIEEKMDLLPQSREKTPHLRDECLHGSKTSGDFWKKWRFFPKNRLFLHPANRV
jgi:hypothetical protein